MTASLTTPASFGSVPKSVLAKQREYQAATETRPDKFLRYDFAALLNKSRSTLAEQLNIPTSTVVMIPNATTGVNLVLRNLVYEPEDTIVYFSTSYGACQNVVAATMEFSGAKGHRIELSYPTSVSRVHPFPDSRMI